MTKKILAALLAVLALAGLGIWWKADRSPSGQSQPLQAGPVIKYQCPMHPQIVRDEPGDCPICHMHLEKVVMDASHDHAHDAAGQASHAAPASAGRKILKYRHPMDPKVFSDKPAKDSMGMDFIPVYADELEGAGRNAAPGHAAFTLSPERQQLIGVKTTPVGRLAVIKTLRLPGRMGDDGATVLAQALEIDAGALKRGLKATVKAGELPRLEARITGIDSHLDAYSRTFGVVLALAEEAPRGLRPGVYCDVRVEVKADKVLAIPKDSVLDTGEQQLVFVSREGGRFEPRAVVLGREGDTHVEVVKGLAEGEKVVSAANFLIDSESRFKSAVEQF
jgi:Cu(I)/Ag(I) efflux system membrane fusion protein